MTEIVRNARYVTAISDFGKWEALHYINYNRGIAKMELYIRSEDTLLLWWNYQGWSQKGKDISYNHILSSHFDFRNEFIILIIISECWISKQWLHYSIMQNSYLFCYIEALRFEYSRETWPSCVCRRSIGNHVWRKRRCKYYAPILLLLVSFQKSHAAKFCCDRDVIHHGNHTDNV